MKLNVLAFSMTLGACLSFSQMALADHHLNDAQDGVRQVNQVVWDKSGKQGFEPLSASQMPANQANMVFIRPLDSDGLQTSVNVGIDDRFQVSLQGGYYSQVMECAGEHRLSVATTGEKINDLNEKSRLFKIAPQQNSYFYVDVSDVTAEPSIRQISEQDALRLLQDKWEQTHQISRVVAECDTPRAIVITPAPVVVEPQPVVEAQPVVLDQPIRLDVLFNFDSDIVQPVYNQKIQEVARFMEQYPNTVTRIEGHTDSTGSSRYNLGLSQRRAESVKNELVNRYGVDRAKITTAGYGETRPVATNETPQGRQQNRRVVAIISNN